MSVEPLHVAALGSLLISLWALGRLPRDPMAGLPARHVGIELIDLPVAVGVLMLMSMVASVIVPEQTTLASDKALYLVTAQLLVQVPPVVYVLARVHLYLPGKRVAGLFVGGGSLGRELAHAARVLVPALALIFAASTMVQLALRVLEIPSPAIGHELLEQMHASRSPLLIAAVLFTAVVIAPIAEEVLFRGLVQTSLLGVFGWRYRWPVVLLGAALFAVVHTPAVADASPQGAGPWPGLIVLWFIGVVLGVLYERRGGLVVPIIVHAAFNALMIAVVLAMPPGNGPGAPG